MGSNPLRHARRSGFTLVELLVVIGIIALLISVLLPALNASRKQADRVKCLAAMQQIGQSYFQYGVDNKGWWPTSEHTWYNAAGAKRVKRWHDFVGKYVNGNRDINYNGTQVAGTTDPVQIWTVKDTNSILWGCPQWRRSTKNSTGGYENDNTALGKFHPGYAMSPYHTRPATSSATALAQNRAFVSQSSATAAPVGKYFKQSQWKNASDNALLTESVHGILAVPNVLGSGWPYQPDTATPMIPEPDPTPSVGMTLDFNRHSKTGTGTKPTTPSMNMLFADGHASTVSAREAYKAIVKK